MGSSLLFNLIQKSYLHDLRRKIEEKDAGKLDAEVEKYREALEEGLTEQQSKLLRNFEISLIDKCDNLHAAVEARLLYLGIKIGLEMQEDIGTDEIV